MKRFHRPNHQFIFGLTGALCMLSEDYHPSLKIRGMLGPLFLYHRPYARELLQSVGPDIGIYSSLDLPLTRWILDSFEMEVPMYMVKTQEYLQEIPIPGRGSLFYKDRSHFKRRSAIIIDGDIRWIRTKALDTHIRVKPWTGEEEDEILKSVLAFLEFTGFAEEFGMKVL